MLPEPAAEELRELVRLRERLLGDLGDRLRQLHRAVDLGFPEFTNMSARLKASSRSRFCRVIQRRPRIKTFPKKARQTLL